MTIQSDESEPSVDAIRQAAYRRYLLARSEAATRWSTRGTWLAYGAAAVVFLLTTLTTMDAIPDWSITIALFAAVATLAVTITVVYPRLPQPTVPCPYCARRVPLAKTQMSPVRAIELLERCPHCGGDLS